jgi:hypothetical protein
LAVNIANPVAELCLTLQKVNTMLLLNKHSLALGKMTLFNKGERAINLQKNTP